MALVKYCDLPSRKSGKSLAQIKKGDSIEVNLLEIDDLFEFQYDKYFDKFEVIDGITDEDRQWSKDVDEDRIREQGL